MSVMPFLFFVSLTGKAQIKEIQFQILDKQTGSGVPYANVGVVNKPIGTNANNDGQVSLKINLGEVEKGDSLKISCIGYGSLSFQLFDFLEAGNPVIYLTPKTEVLQEVVIEEANLKPKILGKKKKGALTHFNIYYIRDSIDDGLSKEFGIIINSKRVCLLDDVNIFFSSNRFRKIKFRLNIYPVDKELIGENMLREDIFFEVTNSHVGWVAVDLKPHNILLDPMEFILSAQVIETEFEGTKPGLSVPVVTPSINNGFVYRDKNQNTWSVNKSANPSIYLNTHCAKRE